MLEEMDKAKQAGPAQQIQLEGAVAQVEETKSKTALNMAKAQQAMTPEMPDQPQMEQQEPFAVQAAQADIENTMADTDLKRANTQRAVVQTQLAPAQFAEKQRIDRASMAQKAQSDQMRAKQANRRPAA